LGTEKAFFDVDGRPLVARIAGVLDVAGAYEVFVVGGDPTRMAEAGLRHEPDDRPGAGPLAATLTALDRAVDDTVVVVACDLPDLGPRTVTEILGALVHGAGRPQVAVPVVDGRRQYLCAAWNRSARDALSVLVGAGTAAMHEAFDTLDVVEVRPGRPDALRDVDTPAQRDPH
jgi:molybdopterin-guanine dinucleotide biosynthesis protein A